MKIREIVSYERLMSHFHAFTHDWLTRICHKQSLICPELELEIHWKFSSPKKSLLNIG